MPNTAAAIRFEPAFCDDIDALWADILSRPMLHELDLRQNPHVADLAPIVGLKDLHVLCLRGVRAVSRVDHLAMLPQLEYVDLTGTSVVDIQPLQAVQSLRSLVYFSPKPAVDTTVLARFTQLRQLSLAGTRHGGNFGFLRALPQLHELDLGYTDIVDLSDVAGMSMLEELELGHSSVRDLGAIAGLRSLQTLGLDVCENVADLSPLAGLPHLMTLSAQSCPLITDVSPLASATALETVILRDCTGLTDATPLLRLPNLKFLALRGSGARESLGTISPHIVID